MTSMGKASKEGLHSKRSVAARKSLSSSEMSSLNSAGGRREIVEELLPLFVRYGLATSGMPLIS